MYGIDLHTHSTISDGTLSPESLVLRAKEVGIHTLALTDHDTIDGINRATQTATQHGIQLISGVEISSQWQRPNTKKTYGVHIVALNMKNLEPILALLTQQQQIRHQRAIAICKKLERVINYNPLDDILPLVDGQIERITRNHIAHALLNTKRVNRIQTAFDLYLKQGKPAYVDLQWVELADVIQSIHASGGFAVLAHPCDYALSSTNLRYLIELFAHHQGDAIELCSDKKPLSTRQMIDRHIQQHQLKVSVGSDFHGDHMSWRKLGHVPQKHSQQIGIWDYFS